MHIRLALALLLAPAAAEAQLRATYEDPSGQKLVIETSGAGHARVNGPDPEQYGILRDGGFYIVARKEERWTVARIEDVAAAIDKVVPPIFKDLFGAAAGGAKKAGSARFEAQGKASHLGREGQNYFVYYPTSQNPDDPTEMLISTDPDLKPVGQALEQFTIGITVLMSGLIGPAAADDVRDTRALFALGTPLVIENGYRLASIEKVDVAHERMELPAKPQMIEEIMADVKVRSLTPEELAEPDQPR